MNVMLWFNVSGSLVRVPETSFNHLDGRLADLATTDAKQFQSAPAPNAIGL